MSLSPLFPHTSQKPPQNNSNTKTPSPSCCQCSDGDRDIQHNRDISFLNISTLASVEWPQNSSQSKINQCGKEDDSNEKKKKDPYEIFFKICNQRIFIPWELVFPSLSLAEVETFYLPCELIQGKSSWWTSHVGCSWWARSWYGRHRSTPGKWLLADFIISSVYLCAPPSGVNPSGEPSCVTSESSVCIENREQEEEESRHVSRSFCPNTSLRTIGDTDRPITKVGIVISSCLYPSVVRIYTSLFLVSVQCGGTHSGHLEKFPGIKSPSRQTDASNMVLNEWMVNHWDDLTVG